LVNIAPLVGMAPNPWRVDRASELPRSPPSHSRPMASPRVGVRAGAVLGLGAIPHRHAPGRGL